MELVFEEDTERGLGGRRAGTHCLGIWLLEPLAWRPCVGFLAPSPEALWFLFSKTLSVHACSLGAAHSLSP